LRRVSGKVDLSFLEGLKSFSRSGRSGGIDLGWKKCCRRGRGTRSCTYEEKRDVGTDNAKRMSV
jgi:hypothetical protein